MIIETLEPRVLFSGAGHSVAVPEPLTQPVHRVTLHHDSTPKFLPISILGSYHGNYSLHNSTVFEPASMVITQQKRHSFRGAITLAGITRPFRASLSRYRAKGSQGPGYYAVSHYSSRYWNVGLVAAIVPGQDVLAPGYTYIGFQMSDGWFISLWPDSQETAP